MNTHPLKLLLVEDDAVFAAVLMRSLQRRGHSVEWAVDTAAARTLAKQHTFSHTILDLKLEHESGLSLIPELLAIQPSLNILVLTGYASIQTTVQAMKLGAINYLCKPADTDTILSALLKTEPDEAELLVVAQPMSIDRLEWEHIQRVLAEHHQNISATARALGMHRRTLQRKLGKKPLKH